jgi:hypothetical protein
MNNLKPLIKKLFSVKNLLITLLITFIVLFVIMIVFIISIYFDQTPSLSLTSKGIQTFFEIYKIPIAIAASLLAIATLAVTTLRTINSDTQIMEMRTQREASYQPTLVILRNNFNIQTGFKPTHKSVNGITQIVKTDPFLILHYESEKGNQPIIFIENIGKGVATNIKYKFIYPINECMDIMKSYDAFNYFYISFDANKGSILTKGSPQLAFEAYYSEEINEKFLDYILTIDNAQQPTKIVLPYFYTLLNFFKDEVGVYTNNKQKFNGIKIGDIFPKLQFEISYSDIGGQSYTKKFELNITAKFFVQLLDGAYQFNEGNYNYDIIPIELNQ